MYVGGVGRGGGAACLGGRAVRCMDGFEMCGRWWGGGLGGWEGWICLDLFEMIWGERD